MVGIVLNETLAINTQNMNDSTIAYISKHYLICSLLYTK